MPTISIFYGISVKMYAEDHLPPHIHVFYGDDVEMISIRDGRVLKGTIPKRAHKLAMEWWEIHRDELEEMWDTQKLNKKLPPLE